MDQRGDEPPAIRYSAGEPPQATPYAPAPPPAAPERRGIAPAAVAGIAAAVLVVGLGGGYLIFHKDSSGGAGNIKAALQAWSDNGGQTRMSEFTTDIDQLTTAASSQDYAGVNAACVALQATVESAQAYQPIPDAQAQTSWAAGLAAYARGATDCIAGTEQLDASLIDQFNNELGIGNTDLGQAAARLRQVNGG